jgi:hypothetical protein
MSNTLDMKQTSALSCHIDHGSGPNSRVLHGLRPYFDSIAEHLLQWGDRALISLRSSLHPGPKSGTTPGLPSQNKEVSERGERSKKKMRMDREVTEAYFISCRYIRASERGERSKKKMRMNREVTEASKGDSREKMDK